MARTMMAATWSAILSCCCAAQLLAQARPPADSASEARFELFPRGQIYDPHLADPQRPGFGMALLAVGDAAVVDSGERRVFLALGGRFGVLQWRPGLWAEGVLQLNFEAGFYGQFDAQRNYDNVGWDGVYALMLSARGRGPAVYRIGVHHTSSHIGDELIERTGIARIDYTREELQAAISVAVTEDWRLYLEAGWGYELRNEDLQEPGRWRAGAEYQRGRSLWRGRLGWYAALDVGAYEESDWEIDWNAQTGIIIPSGDRNWRLGVAYRDGRVPLGELFRNDESYLALGLWLDV